MATEQDVISKLRQFRTGAKHAGKVKAVTFAPTQVLEDGTSITDVRDRQRSGYIWVRIDNNVPQATTDDARAAVSVRCLKVANYKEGLPVWIEKDADGEWHVEALDEAQAIDTYQDAAANMTLPELSGDIVRLILLADRFKYLRCRQAPEFGGLNVIIEDGIYLFSDDSYAWLDKTPIDLSTISVSSGKKRPVLIGIDPATNTSTTLAGTEVPNTAVYPAFTLADYNELIRTDLTKMWLKGYERKDGVTSFQTLDDLVDVRPFLSPGASGISSGGYFMPVDLTFTLTIPANRQVPVRRLTVSTGTLTVEGILDIF